MMTSEKSPSIATVLQFLQLFVLVVGVAGIFAHIGRRDNQLQVNTLDISGLRIIAQDLLEAQITSASNDARIFESLDNLKDRVDRLERP